MRHSIQGGDSSCMYSTRISEKECAIDFTYAGVLLPDAIVVKLAILQAAFAGKNSSQIQHRFSIAAAVFTTMHQASGEI
ncbi:MAG: hypothetical protein NVSMB28_00490 [Collimonas sp.]